MHNQNIGALKFTFSCLISIWIYALLNTADPGLTKIRLLFATVFVQVVLSLPVYHIFGSLPRSLNGTFAVSVLVTIMS